MSNAKPSAATAQMSQWSNVNWGEALTSLSAMSDSLAGSDPHPPPLAFLPDRHETRTLDVVLARSPIFQKENRPVWARFATVTHGRWGSGHACPCGARGLRAFPWRVQLSERPG